LPSCGPMLILACPGGRQRPCPASGRPPILLRTGQNSHAERRGWTEPGSKRRGRVAALAAAAPGQGSPLRALAPQGQMSLGHQGEGRHRDAPSPSLLGSTSASAVPGARGIAVRPRRALTSASLLASSSLLLLSKMSRLGPAAAALPAPSSPWAPLAVSVLREADHKPRANSPSTLSAPARLARMRCILAVRLSWAAVVRRRPALPCAASFSCRAAFRCFCWYSRLVFHLHARGASCQCSHQLTDSTAHGLRLCGTHRS
jgi:hypothetical protein